MENLFQNILIAVLTWVVLIGITGFIRVKSQFKNLKKKKDNNKPEASWEDSWKEPLRQEISKVLTKIRSVETQNKKIGQNIFENKRCYVVLGRGGVKSTGILTQAGVNVLYEYPGTSQNTKEFFNWQVSDNAVYIHVPRTEMVSEVYNGEKLKFLMEELKEVNSKVLTGIITYADLPSLQQEDCREEANEYRMTIDTILETLYLDVPVYVIGNSLEALPGYQAFFSLFNEDIFDQTLGFCLSYKESAMASDILGKRLHAMIANTKKISIDGFNSGVTGGYSVEDITVFPDSLKKLQKNLELFVLTVLKKSLKKENHFLRGLYFASGAVAAKIEEPSAMSQPGSSNDPFATEAFFEDSGFESSQTPFAEEEKKPANDLKTPANFLMATLKFVEVDKVITRFAKHKQKSASKTSIIFSLLLTLGGIGIASIALFGYTSGNMLLKHWEEKLEQVKSVPWQTSSDMRANLNSLETLRETITQIENQRPLTIAPGLYRDSEILPMAVNHYEKMMQVLMTKSLLVLEQNIRQDITDLNQAKARLERAGLDEEETLTDGEGISANLVYARKTLYTDLKTYLSLTDVGRAHYDEIVKESLIQNLRNLWQQTLRLPPEEAAPQHLKDLRNNAEVYVDNLLDGDVVKMFQARESLVEKARAMLVGGNKIEGLYDRMLVTFQSLAPITYSRMALEDNGMVVADEEVPGIYSRNGYNNHVKEFIKNESRQTRDWVLGEQKTDNPDAEPETNMKLAKALRQRYFKEYELAWVKFLNSIRVNMKVDYQEIGLNLENFASAYQESNPQGAQAFFYKIWDELNLLKINKTEVAEKALEHNKGKLGVLNRRYKGAVGSLTDKALLPEEKLARKFESIKIILESLQKGDMDKYFSSLRSFSQFIVNAGTAKQQVVDYMQQAFSETKANELNMSLGLTEIILQKIPAQDQAWTRRMFDEPLKILARQLLQITAEKIADDYKKEIYGYYKTFFSDKYPFNLGNEDRQVSLDELSGFFNNEDGNLKKFLKSIEPFVEINAKTSVKKHWNTLSLPIADEALKGLVRAKYMSSQLYSRLSKTLKFWNIDMTIQPNKRARIDMDLGKESVSIDRSDRPKKVSFKWPQRTFEKVNLKVTSVNGEYNKVYTGDWSLMQFLAPISTKLNNNKMKAQWRVRDRSYYLEVNMDILVDRPNNPFGNPKFFQFTPSEEFLKEVAEIDPEEIQLNLEE